MPHSNSVSVLLVDDQPRNLVAMQGALGRLDCSLVTAPSGEDALRCLLKQDFAAIVLDIHLPGMDGFHTASLIRARRRSESTPIIFLTADDRGGAQVLEGYQLGAVDYMYKPFDAEILRSKVGVFVELYRKTAALEVRTAELMHMTGELEQRTVELGLAAGRLGRSEEHFRALIEMASDVILIMEANGNIRYASPSVERTLGFLPEELCGRGLPELMHADDVAALRVDIARIMKTGRNSPSSRRWRHRDGSYRTLESTVTNMLHTPSVAGVVVHARDISEREHAEDEVRTLNAEVERARVAADLRIQALHDGLTGLANRVLLYERLESTLNGFAGNTGQCALLLLDLDRFKEVNDTLGHQMGDSLLQQIGQRLQAAVRAIDLVARLGGDEFALLLPWTDARRAAQVAAELAEVLQTPFLLEHQAISVMASIGIVVSPQHGADAESLLRHVDAAMYQAKASGAGVVIYNPVDDQHRPDRLALLGELRLAIERDELLIHYQPEVDLRDGTLVGLEALVRWQHPRRGLLPPSEFIPLAELSGLIHPLTLWVLEAALRQQQIWRASGLQVPVAVNLSRRMLHDPGLSETVAHLLTAYDVPASALILELTESSLMVDPARAGENLKHLRALGLRMSIDDFGTGYSSLASLKNLPVDELKIDGSFVHVMGVDASARAIVRAIIDLADALKLRVVAEGVEDRATWDLLVGLGCDVAQGYVLSPPVGAAEVQAWVEQVGPVWQEIATRPTAKDPLQERIRARGARLTAEEEFVARHEAEAALHVSEERNRLALRAAGMGTWDWDPLANVLHCSVEMQALYGMAPSMSELEKEIRAAVAEQRETDATFRVIWPDGSVHWIENKGRGLSGPDGALQRMTGTSMDVTERKLAEEALRASEERFRRQYKGIPLPTYSWSREGDDFVLQDYNDAANSVTEGEVRKWLGSRASVRYADEPAIVADLHACLTEQRTIRREMMYRFRTTGRVRQLALTYVFVPPLTVMLHTEDVSDARQAEQQREAMARSEKLRALGQMATGIAHDLNQSLMLVSSYSDLARQALVHDPPDLAEAGEMMTTATQAALDGGETVKRLLMFTRAVPEHDSQVVELGNVVRDAAQLTAPRWRDAAQAEGRPISLHVETLSHPTVRGSPGQLRELMTNLIFNAVDALPLGGTIRLRVLTEDVHGVVEVADSGVGMTAEVQERVFEPFFTTKGARGTGLGLAMVFGIVEQHGGHVDLRSAPGEGTTFRIRLPLVNAPAATEPAAVSDAAGLEPPRPLRVLVVDDEPMMTRAVARMLKPAGHLVSVAGSGEDALQQLAEHTFDVVVSDMGMGAGMNGWDLADAVKARWPGVRFLLATGWGAAIDSTEARARGIEAVLAKPYHPVDLLQAVSRLKLIA